ncbi:MAG: CehA/McbA family metallohydrolase [Syntrophomonadaceae bacterium]|nr:CehA/McbA family metallohydrolase [Syntrophomonadaceae bacterium]
MFEYKGHVHIHSRYSDGGGKVKQIAARAAQAGLDFIVITDHYNLNGLYEGEEGYRSGVLVMIGMEVNQECNHYLALGVKEVIANNDKNPQAVIDEVNCQKGIGVIAHPFEKGSPYYQKGRTYEWKDWSVAGFQGIEIWNYLSQFRDACTSILKSIYLLFNPIAGLSRPCSQALKTLDQLQEKGHKVFAYGGSDAHGTIIRVGRLPVKVSPYYLCFRLINMHVLCKRKLSGDLQIDKEQIYEALREGRSWIACDYYRSSDGFRFELHNDIEAWPIGSSIKFTPNLKITVKTPASARVVLLHNGRYLEASQGKSHFFTNLQPGVYRIEAYLKDKYRYRPWIYTNPIWIN